MTPSSRTARARGRQRPSFFRTRRGALAMMPMSSSLSGRGTARLESAPVILLTRAFATSLLTAFMQASATLTLSWLLRLSSAMTWQQRGIQTGRARLVLTCTRMGRLSFAILASGRGRQAALLEQSLTALRGWAFQQLLLLL